jgi:TolA-binding protein
MRRGPLVRSLLLAAGSGVLSGCFLWTSADQGAELQRRATALEERTTQLETGLGTELRTEVEHAKTKVAELESVLARATELVTHTSADTGAQVEVLQQQIATQEGAIAELRHELERIQEEFREQQADYESRMKKLARRAGVDMPLEEAEIPADRAAHWQAAQQAFEAREHSTARALLRAYVSRHRDDEHADDAQLMLGRSYLSEDRPATALGELRHVITDFARGDAVPAALLAMADAFYRLHACDDARTALETIQRSHPRSPQAAEARTRLRDIQRAPAGYCSP